MNREQAFMIFKLIERRRAADYGNFLNARRRCLSACVGVGGAAGNRENPKTIDPETIRDLIQERRPVYQQAARLKSGVANPRPIRRDNSRSKVARRVMGELRHCSRARPAMAEKNGHAARIAVFA